MDIKIEQLWNYIDNSCSEAEREIIEVKLMIDEGWQQLYQELLLIDRKLGELALEKPTPSLIYNVMDQIAEAT